MRIDRVSIESFGRLFEREFELKPGFNVFYGPNESGKTTVMEFIRSTLVPTTKKKLYPERAKSNSGFIEAQEDGKQYVIRLDYRQRVGDVPECISGMDPDLYRSIHAMGYYDLEDDGPITNNEIYSKYLTIPGGEAVPAAIKEIDSRITEQVGTTPRASSALNDCQADLEKCQDTVSDLKSKSFAYSDILDERKELEERLAEIVSYNENARSVNGQADIVDRHKGSFERLQSLRSRRDEIRSKPLADDAAVEKHRRLESEVTSKQAAFDTLDSHRRSILKGLAADEAAIRPVMGRMFAVEKSYPEYRERSSRPAVYEMVRGRFNPVVAVIGVMIMLLAAVPFILNMENPAIIAAICVIAGIAVISVYAVARPKNHKVSRDPHNEKWIADYESEVESLMAVCGMKHMSYDSDVDIIKNLTRTMTDLDANMPAWSKANSDLAVAKNDLTYFLLPYGGDEGFAKSKEDYRELLVCESRIQAVSETIRSAGYDSDKPFPAIERIQVREQEQTDTAKRIGLLDERLDGIMKDGMLDREMDRLSSLKECRDSLLREGAVSVLSACMIDAACAELYSSVQPEVLKIADTYLSMMTCGSYHLDSDPRNPELSVVIDGEKKCLRQCSSGTRSQILLSLKLAISKQMCGGKIPIILDDVLITFDANRAEGACKALSEISSEMQVLLFTCSDTVEKICEGIPGANIIRM